ncbi:MAG: LEA type 2 family protein [Proteobacteria bacterium]|nr:LEA type 2 family protein [Pseudomonadota bacterium]
MTRLKWFVPVMMMLSSVMFVSGCATLKQLIKKPTIEFSGMAVKEMTLFDGTYVFTFNVANPNPLGVPIEKISYDLKIDGKEFFQGDLDNKETVPGNGMIPVDVPVQLYYLDFFKTLVDFVGKDHFEYDLSGSVFIYGLSIPFHTTGQLPVPKPPQVSLGRVEIKSMSFANASVVFVLDMVNDNPFPIMMDGLNYTIRLAGNELAGGSTKAVQPLGQNSKSTIDIPLTLSVLKMGKSVLNLLTGSSSEYEISGAMQFQVPKLGIKEFAYSKKGTVPVGKL